MRSLLPVAPPIPTILAAATLPFLFDYTFTIYGGNLFSTLAGEYAFSFSLSLAVLFLGLFACSVREGRYRGWAAVVLAVCVLSHIVPAMYTLGGAVILTVVELLPARWGIDDSQLLLRHDSQATERIPRTRTLWWAGSTVGIGLLLSGWWLVPFGLEHAYSTSMGYTNVEGWAQYFREADTWALVLAGIGAVSAFLIRSRFGITITVLGIVSALATALDPQGSLYNVRLLPLWFISVYLMAAWTFGTACIAIAESWRRMRAERWAAQAQAPPWAEGPPTQRPWEEPRTPGDLAPDAGYVFTPRRPPPRAGLRPPSAVRCSVWSVYCSSWSRPSSFNRRRWCIPGPTRSRTGRPTTTRATRGRRPTPSTGPSSRPWRRSASATGAGARCGSTATARTGSARRRH